MLASVIICTYNRSAMLKASLQSMMRQDLPADRFEIIVVDNNSSDDTRAVIEEAAASSGAEVIYLFEGRQGLSHARNSGIASARGEIVVFTDDDISAEPGWLRNLLAAFDDPEVGCAGGPLKPVWPKSRPAWLSDDMLPAIAVSDFPWARESGEFRAPHYPWGANIAFRRKILVEVGPFPTNLGRTGNTLLSNEELELCRKVEASGRRIAFAPEAVIHHKIAQERLTKLWFLRRYYYQGRSDAVLDARTGGNPYRSIRQLVKDMVWRGFTADDKVGKLCLRRSVIGYLDELMQHAPRTGSSPRSIESCIAGIDEASKDAREKIDRLKRYIQEKEIDLVKFDELVREKDKSLGELERVRSEQALQLAAVEGRTVTQREEIVELGKYIDAKHRDLERYDALLKERAGQLAEAQSQVEKTAQQLAEAQSQVKQSAQQLAEAQTQASNSAQQLRDSERLVTELRETVEFLKEQIDRKDGKLGALQTMIGKSQKQITELSQAITNLQNMILDYQKELSQHGRTRRELQQENIRLLSELGRAKNEVALIHDSWSWKITAPLRKVAAIALRLR